MCYPRDMGASPSVFSRAGLRNIVPVECLQMIKPIVTGFVLLEVDATLDDECGISEHSQSFREMKCYQGCSKTLWMGI